MLILMFAIGPLIAMTGCGSGDSNPNGGNPKPWTVWFSNPSEYATNDLRVAQRETPFGIVIPSYVPQDFSQFPVIQGRAKNQFDDHEPVTITYERKGNSPLQIREFNMIMAESLSGNTTQLNYDGTAVTEGEDTTLLFQKTGIVPVSSLSYAWNKNGIHFSVTVDDYQRDEVRQVIESMVK